MPIDQVFAAIRWWFMIMLLGAAATPLTLLLFKRLPDRGYTFTKLVGILLVSYLFWIFASLGFLGNDIGGMLFALLALLVISYWSARREGVNTLQWLRDHRRHVLTTELLFALLFGLWVWVRSQNPSISATEKPMEFAFLNAIGRSSSFPPNDPWLSGFAISYYYFGYVMTSLIGRLAAVPAQIGFNLGIAWLVAGTAVSAFGLVFNLTAARGTRRTAYIVGLIAAIALPIAGNLEAGLEMLHENGVGPAEFWQWLDIREINGPAVSHGTPRYDGSSWWWWRSSRVIHEYHLSGRAEEGLEPIAEFPAFSFVLGDMHPHVLALPFALLSIAVAFTWWLGGVAGDQTLAGDNWDASGWRRRVELLIRHVGLPMWSFTVVLLGGLSFLNTWDVLIHLIVLLGAFLLGQCYRAGWHRRVLTQTALVAALLILPAVLLYLPFYTGFRSQAGPPFLLPMLVRPTRLSHFLVIFGMPLWSIVLLLLVSSLKYRFKHWRWGLASAVAVIGLFALLMLMLGWIIAGSQEGAQRAISLADELGIPLAVRPQNGITMGWGLSAVAALVPRVLEARVAYPGLALLLAAMLALCVIIWINLYRSEPRSAAGEASEELVAPRELVPPEKPVPLVPLVPQPGVLPFALLLVAVGALLTLAPEFVYLRDNFGVRLNTVFKFYYQAWVMFGTAALFALAHFWRSSGPSSRRIVPLLAAGGYLGTLCAALLFPALAIRSRSMEFRGPIDSEMRQAPTLDGFASLSRTNPDEHAALIWLRENVSGTPVILEAVGGQYSGYARVSAGTGLPTVLGWAGHELQWRGSSNPEPSIRDPLVRQIYTDENWERTARLLDQFDISYVYVGILERTTYGAQIDEKFAQHMEIAFNNDTVAIYQWHPQ